LLTLIFNAFVNDLIVNSPAHHSAFKTQTEKQTKTVYFILQNTMWFYELIGGFCNLNSQTHGGNFTIFCGVFAQLILLPFFSIKSIIRSQNQILINSQRVIHGKIYGVTF